jgi:N-acetylmuramoyl-L-alanine amidase
MSSTLSEDGPVVAQPMTRGRHAAARPKHRLRSLGSLARSIQVPVPAPVSRRSEERRTGPAPDRPSGAAQPADTVEVAVQAGDTVGDVAARYGLSTASFIALNGLSWRSTLTEGDRLLVRAPRHAAPPAMPVPPERIHRVQAGETLAAIAARHGVGVAALLLANGLSRGAEPLPGTVLTLPGAVRRPTGDALELTGDMLANAEAIALVARALDVPDDGLVIALAAAMQDSSLRNLDFGEDDAVGLFQQRPSEGWGTAPALLDPRRAALAFFRGGEDGSVGLLGTAGWELMPVGEAAHAVQRLSTPAAYAKWERCARAWAERLGRR